MIRPTDDQINKKIADILRLKFIRDWATNRNASADLPPPETKWNKFGKIVRNIYLDHMGWPGDRNLPVLPAVIAEILFAEPWLMPFAWIKCRGWKWDGENWVEA